MRRVLPLALVLAASACSRRPAEIPKGSVVLAETEAKGGSRVVLRTPAGTFVLSKGLAVAGEPTVSPDGRRVVFAGGESPCTEPQIWEAELGGGRPEALTALVGGATSPALLQDGTLVFVGSRARALFTLAPGADEPRRLTFGAAPVSDPFVLAEGRILFVAEQPSGSRRALFAVNDDGTGVAPYAANHEGALFVARPRQESDGRVSFTAWDPSGGPRHAESVLTARPWLSREAFAAPALPPASEAGWRVVAATPLAPRAVVRRRLSTVDPTKKTGILLCLDADRTAEVETGHAARVRILTADAHGRRALGEVPVAADGSFLAEVPADVPLGIEALAADGKVLRSVAPWFWVRPGETRGCIGCHEPHGVAPRNRRPLAVKSAPVKVAS